MIVMNKGDWCIFMVNLLIYSIINLIRCNLGGDPVGAFWSKSIRNAPLDRAHAVFFDQTHDNPSPYEVQNLYCVSITSLTTIIFQKRTAYDYIPTSAITAMSYCISL